MSDFFRSEQVQNTIMELAQLQQQLVTETPYLPMMDDDQKRQHLVTLKSFLEKQKLFCKRDARKINGCCQDVWGSE